MSNCKSLSTKFGKGPGLAMASVHVFRYVQTEKYAMFWRPLYKLAGSLTPLWINKVRAKCVLITMRADLQFLCQSTKESNQSYYYSCLQSQSVYCSQGTWKDVGVNKVQYQKTVHPFGHDCLSLVHAISCILCLTAIPLPQRSLPMSNVAGIR